ncbi:glycosyltransferase family 4 protein [Flavihumibacter sp. R14]|nr:glycosyltransferase family 4 protein [Flavihumibacter soli]
MAERKRIGLTYSYNEGWIGGTYYIENLISALNTLDDKDKPHISLITNYKADFKSVKMRLNYPYISFQRASGEKNQVFQFVNKVTRRLFNTSVFNQKISNLDIVFPYHECVQQSLAKKQFHWIADFQEHFTPDYFDTKSIKDRKNSQIILQASSRHLILSSDNAFQHFQSLYPLYKVKVSVLPFAVTHPDFSTIDFSLLLKKYSLPSQYLICPNQFWKHKNHITILKAVNDLKQQGINITVAFTGNTSDYRNPGYFNELNEYVETNNLNDQIRFLGFIDRLDQLQLMNNAIAVVQPSLFEGWSTVVEDAKSMNKFLLVSDIDIHREQLQNSKAVFFDPLNHEKLAEEIKSILMTEVVPTLFEDNSYPLNISEFANKFLSITR